MISINKYLKNLSKIEFVITYDCTGRCKHCSEGEHPHTGVHIDKEFAARLVYEVTNRYNINTVMTFGGEPLMYSDSVFAIHQAAKDMNVPKRQLITNGFFSKNPDIIKLAAQHIAECGINDVLLSVDAFHQETIPIDTVKIFANEVSKLGVPIRTSPAWLKSREDLNPYNLHTSEILSEFKKMEIDEADGNIIFPEGNALKYLGEYFDKATDYTNPYEENPNHLRTISIEPDGTVLGHNIYTKNILEILDNYRPNIIGE